MGYTRFERARLLGARALQISMGAPPFVGSERTADALSVAIREFADGAAPLTVKRSSDVVD